ncbi:hypothetical protein HanPSC8_Chr12g0538621 [Helianthus annuus]|nr:hypothetical protein HanPSC8_Chr12g0538621 [Helianthus annuus]
MILQHCRLIASNIEYVMVITSISCVFFFENCKMFFSLLISSSNTFTFCEMCSKVIYMILIIMSFRIMIFLLLGMVVSCACLCS